MTRNDIQTYLDAFAAVSEIKGVRFAFTVLKNKKKLLDHVEEDKAIIQEILSASTAFKEFETKRIELCKTHSRKDDKGEAIVNKDKYDIINAVAFETEFADLRLEYKDTIAEREAQLKEFESIMKEEIDINFIKVSFEDLPEDLVEKQMEALQFMINLED